MAPFPDCPDFYLFEDTWFLEIREQIWIKQFEGAVTEQRIICTGKATLAPLTLPPPFFPSFLPFYNKTNKVLNLYFCGAYFFLITASILEQRLSFWIWIWFFRLPTSCKFLCADAGLLFLGHSDLAFLEAILFLSDWQESLLSMARNQKLAGALQQLSNWIYFF